MVRRRSKKNIGNAPLDTAVAVGSSRPPQVPTEDLQQDSSRTPRPKRGFLNTISEIITCSCSSSRDFHTEDGTQDNSQIPQVSEGSALEDRRSAAAIPQGVVDNIDLGIDSATPLGSIPQIMIFETDIANTTFQETAPTQNVIGGVSKEDPFEVPHGVGTDVVVAGSWNDNPANDDNAKNIRTEINKAHADVQQVRDISGADEVTSAINTATSTLDEVDAVTACLRPLRAFDSIINKISEIHPYAKLALSTLSWAAKAILNQTNLDQAVVDLLQKISHVYAFLVDDNTLLKIDLIRKPLGELAKLVPKCVQFIQAYAKTKSFWGRLGSNAFSDSGNTVATYNKALDVLTQQCRDLILGTILGDVNRALCDVDRVQHDIGDVLGRIRHMENDVACIKEETYLNKLAYADGAGVDMNKTCLENTRVSILSEIMDWIQDTKSDTQRVFWLHGEAGKGKSAIAHTVARWFRDVDGFSSCFCFRRDRLADMRHLKIFATVARDLADCNADYRRTLANILAGDASLVHTSDIKQHWEKLIVGGLSQVPVAQGRPIVIVIDALDESGEEASRGPIFDALCSTPLSSLPPNIRILVTSRPLQDITKMLSSSSHIKCQAMNNIPMDTTRHDIQMYITAQLESSEDGLTSKEITRLAEMSDGLFEWARLACEFIKSPKEAATITERYEDLLSMMGGRGDGLLDKMYHTILKDALGTTGRMLTRFHSVMCQILWTKEPLCMDSLTAMRRKFSNPNDVYDVKLVLRLMGALLSGVADGAMPVRPLHASFYEFLMDYSRAGQYTVDIGDIDLDLGFACVR
ncbi:hypothetical protein ID866_9031, partial [Astraeus odoratus]